MAQEIRKVPLNKEGVKAILIEAGYEPDEAGAIAMDFGIDLSVQRVEESREVTEHIKRDNTLGEQL